MEIQKPKSNPSALYTLITVFFFWGFLAASNGIFIPFCKAHFHITQFESQLIDFTFYGGYFVGALLFYAISYISKVDILDKLGYKNGIVLGLLVSVLGALVMIPALHSGTFGFILFALIIITIGFSIQQTAANPFVVALGPPETGSNRLNFAGSINNIGTLIGPIAIKIILFGRASSIIPPDQISLTSVDTLYYVLAGVLLLLAVFFWVSKLPKVTSDEKIEISKKPNLPLFFLFIAFLLMAGVNQFSAITGVPRAFFVYPSLLLVMLTLFLSFTAAKKNKEGWGAMQYPQLILGMFAIFAYVGTEATIQSNLGALLKTPEFGGVSESDLAPYISLYWGSLMIGRWTGAIGAFKLSNTAKYTLLVVVPLVAFGVVLGVNYSSGVDMTKFYPYVFFIFILIIAFFIGRQRPVRTLVVFGLLGITAMIVGLCTVGHFSTLTLISGGLCCSIMWPSIFSLSITGLGKYTAQGSAFLIMMILGGAIIPPIQGFVADSTQGAISGISGIHFSYVVPALGFAYLAWFAWKVSKELKTQGIDLDHVAVSSAKH